MGQKCKIETIKGAIHEVVPPHGSAWRLVDSVVHLAVGPHIYVLACIYVLSISGDSARPWTLIISGSGHVTSSGLLSTQEVESLSPFQEWAPSSRIELYVFS